MKILRTILLIIPLIFIAWYLYDRYVNKTQQKLILAQVNALNLKGEKGEMGEKGRNGIALNDWRFVEKLNTDGSKELVLEVLTNSGFIEFSSSKFETYS